MDKVVEFLTDYDLKFVNDEYFTALISSNLRNKNDISGSSFIINDLDKNNKLVYNSQIKITNKLSQEFLDEIGFDWPNITKNYIINLIKNI